MSYEPRHKTPPSATTVTASTINRNDLYVHSVDENRRTIYFGVNESAVEVPISDDESRLSVLAAARKLSFSDKRFKLLDPSSDVYYMAACRYNLPLLNEPGINEKRLIVVNNSNKLVSPSDRSTDDDRTPLMSVTFDSPG